MLQLELEVMLVCVRAEPYLLDDNLCRIGLHLLGFLLLLIEIFLIVQNFAHRRISLCAYLHQIKTKFIGKCQCLGNRIYTLLGDILSDKTYLKSVDLLIDVQLVLVFLLILDRTVLWSGTGRFESGRFWFVRRCDRYSS